jgi:hypothetical protein
LKAAPRFIAIIDGIEELYLNLLGDEQSQRSVRVLLRDVPQWLSQVPGRPLGLVVFVRQDYVEEALKQNSAQFFAKYEPYALRWDPVEALRLALWLASASKVVKRDNASIATLQQAELIEALVPLWGRKLGSDQSREAMTAEWVLSSLSDLNNRIQARDMVRFMHVASGLAAQESTSIWEDRILTPSAIRNSIAACSAEKVKEVAQEDAVLGKIFQTIRSNSAPRSNPFDSAAAPIRPEDLKVLQDKGVISADPKTSKYWVAPIYSTGLGFRYSEPGRRRNIKLRW